MPILTGLFIGFMMILPATSTNASSNPLISKLPQTDHEYIPYDLIKPEHFLPAAKHHLKEAQLKLGEISESNADPTFQNTVAAMESLTHDLDLISEALGAYVRAEGNQQLRDYQLEVNQLMVKFSFEVFNNEKLFQRVRAVSEKKLARTAEEKELIRRILLAFKNMGAELDDEGKKRLREIDDRLAVLTSKYEENVVKSQDAFLLVITNEAELAGLPEQAKLQAAELAKRKKASGWAFNLLQPSYVPVLKFADRESLRRTMFEAYNRRALNSPFSNKDEIIDILKLRKERAQLLGYKNHPEFVLDDRMAKTPATVLSFLDKLTEAAKPKADQDIAKLKALKLQMTGEKEFYPWDTSYFLEKLKKKEFDFSSEELRPYFPMEKVVEGVFTHASKMYGISFKERTDIPTFNPDVKVYEIYDRDGSYLGLMYADLLTREGKRPGAWMSTVRGGGVYKGQKLQALVSINGNMPRNLKDTPALLSFDDVNTFFHEFGHAIHGILGKGTYITLAAPNVLWDFVEYPSQLMEEWLLYKEVLDSFAAHYETGKKMPDELIKKVKESSKFMLSIGFLRQLQLSNIDMSWHLADPDKITDVENFERQAIAATQLYPEVPNTALSTAFGHIFSGGYSSAYYSYKWAEVMVADTFETFEKEGLYNPKLTEAFRRKILEPGGSLDPADMYRNFMGRDPDPKALLRQNGLIP